MPKSLQDIASEKFIKQFENWGQHLKEAVRMFDELLELNGDLIKNDETPTDAPKKDA